MAAVTRAESEIVTDGGRRERSQIWRKEKRRKRKKCTSMMHLQLRLQPPQHRHRILYARLIDQNLHESPRQRRVLLDRVAKFVEGSRACDLETASERGLEHVPGVEGAFGFTEGEDLVDFV